MIPADMSKPIPPELRQQAKNLLNRLELVSHGKTMRLEPSRGGGEAVFPPGGVPREDDKPVHFEDGQAYEWDMRSHLVYRRRLAGVRTEVQMRVVIADMERSLRAWTHSPPPPKDSKAWERKVAKESGSCVDVGKVWGISAQRVHQLRAKYRDAA